MAAPIQRYSDPRLYGSSFVKPFNASYQWIRTVAHPWHPKCSLITECAVRAMKIVTGVFALALTTPSTLIGRFIQFLHYHSISVEGRAKPKAITVNGMELPRLKACSLPEPEKYHGTSELAAIGILRWGFDPAKTAKG